MEELIIDYQKNLFSIKELSEKYHIGQDKVRKILKDNNIYIRTSQETKMLKMNPTLSLQEIETIIIDNYVKKKYGQVKAGKQLGLSAAAVKSVLKKYNIPIRNLHESICLANQTNDRTVQHYGKDEEFFKKESSNMAWILGFLASDGNVGKDSNRIRIELSSIDAEILSKIKNTIKIDNPIKYRENKKGFNFVSLEWSSRTHKKDLEKYNIVPNKTYILSPPLKLNKKFYIDYIRGYFDGDGTINVNYLKHGKKSIRWGICGASKGVLQWIIDTLYNEYNIPKVNIHKDSSHEKDFYSFTYSTNSSKRIYEILYTDNSIFLKRKKDKFDKIISEFSSKE